MNFFTVKFDLDNVCFFTTRMYLNGTWQEFVIDDYIPCNKSTRMPIFANTSTHEIGWLVVQKAFCKYFKKYFYWRLRNKRSANEYLLLLTGLPCKVM
jgi:hypothetical protein